MNGERCSIRGHMLKKGGYRQEVKIHIQPERQEEIPKKFINDIVPLFLECMEMSNVKKIELERV